MTARAARLLQLLEALRQRRKPVTGAVLADEMAISLRTLYRDIATLREQGAQIEGDPGLGYELRPGFTLPPLMFNADELEALVLGARWVASQAADPELAQAAQAAMNRIANVLPTELRLGVETSGLFVPERCDAFRPCRGFLPCAAPSAANTPCCWTTATPTTNPASAASGPLPWPSSTTPG